MYVLELARDELCGYAGLTSRLWVALREKWRLEVVVEGGPYQADALAAARQVWAVL